MVFSVYSIMGLYCIMTLLSPAVSGGSEKLIMHYNLLILLNTLSQKSVAYISYNIDVSSRCLMLKFIFSSSVANYYTCNLIIILLSLIDYYCY